MSYYVHHTPGRLRVKIPLVKSNQEKAREVREILKELNGVDFISINTVTGSVTVKYDRNSVSADDILAIYKKNYLFDVSRAERAEKSLELSAANASQAVGRVLFGWAMGRMLEGSSLSILTALI
jgi:copper chaperone CopZ